MGNETRPDPNDVRWTPEQWLGISEIGRSLLVSAAAGSGKTAVLARRCVYLVCDAPQPCSIDELLVVTFTEKTADQMRARITEALRDRIGKEPSERLTRQLALVDQAQVSTLHAFCARLLRQHFHLVDLDPGFNVMAAEEARLLRLETVRDLFERRYNDEDGLFQRLIDGYGQGDEERVLRQVLHVHDLLTSVVSPAKWLADARRRIDEAIDAPFETTELGIELLRLVRRGLDALRARCDDVIKIVSGLGLTKYVEHLIEMRAAFGYWNEALCDGGIDALAEVAKDPQWPKLPSVRSDVPGKDFGKSLVDALKKSAASGGWRDMLCFSAGEWRDGLKKMRPYAEVFLELVGQFGEEYGQAKHQMRAVDFADLERFTLQALSKSTTETGAPSPAARAFHTRFAHVLVDEFQDINEVQDAILALVSRECLTENGGPRSRKKEAKFVPNLFCVGDVKQSIYRFRLAEARRFLDRQQAFRADGSHGRVIDLQANFRSRRPLLDALNCIFSRLMTADAVDIEYDKTHELLGRTEYPDLDDCRSFRGAPIDLHVLPDAVSIEEESAGEDAEDDDDDEIGRTEREAIVIAMEIKRMLGIEPGTFPMQVMHPGAGGALEPRNATFRDIVILLRSMQHKADQFADVLRQHGIPVYAPSNAGYFASMEVRDMVALLHLLDNQRQDVPLAAVLRSPLGKLPEPETSLARIRTACAESVPFHEAALRYAAEQNDDLAARLKIFFSQLQHWRQFAQMRSIADVIWKIYHETGYLAYVAGLNKGEQRVKNLMDLHERAAEFGQFQSRGLSRFMRFLEQLQEESDLGQASTASEAEDVVRIMSVHAAKGLEFSIVFLPDLGKRINLQSCQGPILADRSAGLGMVVVDEEKRCRYPSLASTIVQSRLRQQSLAEELRVLYVAMTRAREHLILIGTLRKKTADKWESRWLNHPGQMPTDDILSAATMLDWICPAEIMTRNEPRQIFRVISHSAQEVAEWKTPASVRQTFSPLQTSMANLEPLPEAPAPNDAGRMVIDRLSFEYPHQKFSAIKATQSVTGGGHGPPPSASAKSPLVELPERLPILPGFLEKSALSATDRGTATHMVLQFLDFQSACDPADIGKQIKSLVSRRMISPDAAAVVDIAAIAWLMSDSVGQRLRQSPADVRRELPVNFPRPFDVANGNDSLDRVMVRGRIDVLILGTPGATLLDYKTDNVTSEQVPERAEGYRHQLEAYREAIQIITGIKIQDVYLAFLSPRVMYHLGAAKPLS